MITTEKMGLKLYESNDLFDYQDYNENFTKIENKSVVYEDIVDDLMTGGIKKPLSAEQGKVLKQLIDAIGTGGVAKLMKSEQRMNEENYIGILQKGGRSISIGAKIFEPTLFLDGVRIEENRYTIELEVGLITLNEIYSDGYDVTWVVEDKMPYHISFCFPTISLLMSSQEMLSRINIGDVVSILGQSEADDGGHYLVKCENVAKLNSVDIGDGRFLNEIPNTKISDKVSKSGGAMTGSLTVPEFVCEGASSIRSLKINSPAPTIEFNETDTGKKTLIVFDGGSGRIQHDSYTGENILSWDSKDVRVGAYSKDLAISGSNGSVLTQGSISCNYSAIGGWFDNIATFRQAKYAPSYNSNLSKLIEGMHQPNSNHDQFVRYGFGAFNNECIIYSVGDTSYNVPLRRWTFARSGDFICDGRIHATNVLGTYEMITEELKNPNEETDMEKLRHDLYKVEFNAYQLLKADYEDFGAIDEEQFSSCKDYMISINPNNKAKSISEIKRPSIFDRYK